MTVVARALKVSFRLRDSEGAIVKKRGSQQHVGPILNDDFMEMLQLASPAGGHHGQFHRIRDDPGEFQVIAFLGSKNNGGRISAVGMLQKKIILILMTHLLFLPACWDAGPEVSDEARKFRDEALAYIESAKQELSRVDDLTDEAKVGTVLTKLFFKTIKSDHGPLRRLLFLNRSGVVIAELNPDPKVPDGLASTATGYNYGNYQAIKHALSKGKNAQCLLYIYDGKFYFVCSPLKRGGTTVGVMCLAFSVEVIRGRIGVGEDDFLALDFNP